jgi:hypothetical protein
MQWSSDNCVCVCETRSASCSGLNIVEWACSAPSARRQMRASREQQSKVVQSHLLERRGQGVGVNELRADDQEP